MSAFLRTGTFENISLRLFAAYLLLFAQVLLYSGACSSGVGGGGGVGNTNDNGSAQGEPSDNDNVDAGDGSVPSGFIPDGYWISMRSAGSSTFLGLAGGTSLGSAVSIEITEDDGGEWMFSGNWSGDGLSGTCARPLTDGSFDIGDLFDDPPECTGTFADGGAELTLSMTDEGVDYDWVLTRSATPTPAMIASWDTLHSPGGRAIFAFEGRVLNILLLQGSVQQEMHAVWDSTSHGFAGTDVDGNIWTAVLMDGGETLLAWVSDGGEFVEVQTFSRQHEPGVFAQPISGRYMSVTNNGEFSDSLRGQASIVFDGSHLYICQRDDNHRVLYQPDYDLGWYWSVVASWTGDSFQGTSNGWFSGWSGKINERRSGIFGSWGGVDDQVLSFENVRSTSAGELSGLWSSVSTNYHTPSDPYYVFGDAELSFDGNTLFVIDNQYGTQYNIEAQWVEDHFEGQYWSVDDPVNKLQWSGEVVSGGAMIHGKWEMGEWSFTRNRVVTSEDDFLDLEPGKMHIIGNADSPILAVGRDPVSMDLVQVRQNLGNVTQIRRISETGHGGVVDFDARALPVRIELEAGDVFELVYAKDLSSVSYDHTAPGGAVSTHAVSIDLSNLGLESSFQDFETQTGLSADPYRNYLASYGNPWFPTDPIPASWRSASAGRMTAQDGATKFAEFSSFMITGATTIAIGLKLVGAAAFCVGLGGVMLMGIGAILILYALIYYLACLPCTLKCFWTCGMPNPPRGACCEDAGCSFTSQSLCTKGGGDWVTDCSRCYDDDD